MIKHKSKAKLLNKHRRANAFMCSQYSDMAHTPNSHTRIKKQQGFTLIELLVVVSILAALAGITSVAMDGYQQDAEETITRVEMQRIANAIRRFKIDTGYWPKTEVSGTLSYDGEDRAANLGFLFFKPNVTIPDWTPEYAIGWHGPYIDLSAIKPIVADSGNAGCPITTSADYAALQLLPRINSLVDRFQQIREKNTGKEYCVLTRNEKNMDEFKVAEYSASPYLYEIDFSHSEHELCDSNNCIVLRSFGADGKDGYHDDAEDEDRDDDIIFVLQVNA